MSDFLKVIGWVTIIAGIIAGVGFGKANDPMYALVGLESDFRWTVAITWWISGLLSGVIFIALGMILERQDYIHQTVYAIYQQNKQSRQPEPSSQKTSSGNSRMNLSKAKDFKMQSFD